MTLMCRDLSELAHYARVDNVQFRLLEEQHAGQLYFHSRRHQGSAPALAASQADTVGIRIPDHPVALALLEELGEPLLSSKLILPGEEHALNDAEEIREHLDQLDLVLDGWRRAGPTTVIDLTGTLRADAARQGRGGPIWNGRKRALIDDQPSLPLR